MRKIPFYVFKLYGIYHQASSMTKVINKYTIEDANFNKLPAQGIDYVKQLEKAMLKSTTKVHTSKLFKFDQILMSRLKLIKSL